VDQSFLLVLVVAVIVALGAMGVMQARSSSGSSPSGEDSPFGTSTEGMKMCPRCHMGNLWTERRCSQCGRPLAG
jgi:hypothetical protein